MKTAVFYHKSDLDGVFSAATIRLVGRIYEDITLYPYQYGEDIPEIEYGEYDRIWVVDISFGEKTKWQFEHWMGYGAEVIWIDHHVSAINSVEVPEGVKGVREVGVAACLLTWRYLKLGRNKMISLLSAYDVWDKDSYPWDDVEAFQYGMRAKVGLSVGSATNLLSKYLEMSNKDKSITIESLKSNGRAILDYVWYKNKGEMELYAFDATVLGKRAICMNTTEFNSRTFDTMWDEDEYDVMMPFCWNGEKARFGLYTTKDEVDCSEMAKSLGGGGHRKAAGFHLSADNFIKFLNIKKL